MKNLFKIVQKDLKLLIRSKGSALIVILGPLLVIFIAGMAFDNTQTYSITLGTYSKSYNSLTEGFIGTLGENQFKVTKYPDEESCVEAIKEGAVHSCILFSPDFALGQGMNNEVTFYVDYSKINLVYMVLDTITESFSEKSSELSLNLTTVLLSTIDLTRKEVGEKKSTIVTLTTSNDEAGKKVEDTYDKLSALDTSTGLAVSSIANLTSRKNEIASQFSSLEDVASDALSEADSLIDDIEDEIDISSSLTPEEKAALISILNGSRDEFEDIESSFDATTNRTSKRIEELTAAISGVSLGIEDAKQKLQQAESAKSASMSNLEDVKNKINDMLSNIAILQSSMNTIESSINSIQVADASNIVSPVKTTIRPVVAEKTHLNYIFPVLIILVIMFTGILLSTTLIMFEKKTNAYFRNFMSPTKDMTFVLATFVTCFLLLIIQSIIILGLSAVFFGTQIFYTLPKAVPVLLLCITVFTMVGMLVGYLFNSEETATLGAISIGSLLLLLSDVILPLESMPKYVFEIAQYNPFVLGGSLLRKAIIHDMPFSSIEGGLVYLLVYCVAIFILVMVIQSVAKKHYISRYFKKIAAKPEYNKKKDK